MRTLNDRFSNWGCITRRCSLYSFVVILGTAMWLSPCASVAQKEDAVKAKETAIATVLETPVLSTQLDLDENDKSPLRDHGAIAQVIIPPLVARYCKRHRLVANEAEIKAYREWMLAGRTEDGEPLIKKPTPEDLEELDEDGKADIEKWKFNKALYEKYGGRVEFQQAGLEPVDAYRDWLLDEEDAGHFKIVDAKWKDAFWEYFKPKYHRHFADERDPFKTPPWRKQAGE